MERKGLMAQSLMKYRMVGIDTSPFIYHFELHPTYSSVTSTLFEAVERGKVKAVTSMITLMEILVKPKSITNEQAVKEYKFVLETFPNLTLAAVDRNVAEAAAELRAKYQLRSPDALQIGTAKAYNAEAFITNDERLRKVKDVNILLLKDFVP
ncbi:MAG: type II toxin-antitoxin system VapC family toxin [Thaumarchaeota archaeon]|nr:type II toxin-antitoxin system VapC family toxin [Nitrososphaerota archaeon]